MDLLYRRSLMLTDIERRIANISGIRYFLGVDEKDIEEDFNSNGMRGKSVIRAVGALRKLLFDDTDKKFQEFFCINLEFSYADYGTGGVSFEFSDGKVSFDVQIPRARSRPDEVFSWGEQNYQRNLDVFSENTYVGEVSVGMYTSIYCHDCLFSSLKLPEIRNFIREIVHDSKKVLDEATERFKNSFLTYSPMSTQIRTEPLSRMLRSKGFDYTRR
jgi:hypothetical protein